MAIGRKLEGRDRRRVRIRKKVTGSAERPRLTVFRSTKHIYAQVIDDDKGVTLASASTVTTETKGKKTDKAQAIGKALAEACKQKNITAVVFDRNGFRYHGRIKAIAEAAREAGLTF
jgi:large subunit ribosomal protein L18